jgi:TetR/AcrR family transcriptional repressor of nem operon
LSKILDAAISAGETPAGIDTSQRADQLLSVLEGSSFIDWAMQDGRRLELDAL